jgi:hypothetical protein
MRVLKKMTRKNRAKRRRMRMIIKRKRAIKLILIEI